MNPDQSATPAESGVNSARPSDAERERIAARLLTECAEGRLTLGQFSDRASLAETADSRTELDRLVADLPSAGPAIPAAPGSRSTQWHVTPLGGLEREGRWARRRRTVSITLIGGVDLDLREATLPGAEVTVTKVSLLGGVSITVPPRVHVEVRGFSLFGGRRMVSEPSAAPNAPTVQIRAFCLVGGVDVRVDR